MHCNKKPQKLKPETRSEIGVYICLIGTIQENLLLFESSLPSNVFF